MNNFSVTIERCKLPKDDNCAISELINYFNGFNIENIEKNKCYWNVVLKREDYTFCDDFSKFNINTSLFNDFVIANRNYSISLSESWLPFAWSNFLIDNPIPDNLVILHFDYHSDLMSPFIYKYNGEFFNVLTSEQISFNNPSSVKMAIDSGAIPIGSALIPIVWNSKNIKILHVKQNIPTKIYKLERKLINDSLLLNSSSRISVKFSKFNNKQDNLYLITSDLSLLETNINTEDFIILHFDMDFFSNRYNASSSWKTDNYNSDFPLNIQKNLISMICKTLGFINYKFPISCVYIGVSPSFYPCEYWEEGLYFLLNSLKKNFININYLNYFYNKYFKVRSSVSYF